MFLSYCLYFAIIVFSSLFAYCAQHANKRVDERIFRTIVFIILFLPAILRFRIGTDYVIYDKYYLRDNSLNSFEFGINCIYSFCRFFSDSSVLFFLICALLTYFPICFYLDKKNFFYIILFYHLCFCYMDSYNIVRQSLSLSYTICATQFFINSKYKKGFLFCIFACLFHRASYFAVIFLLLSFVYIRNTSRVVITVIVASMLRLINFSAIIFSFINLIIPRFASYFTNMLFVRHGSGIGVLLNMLLPIFMIWKSKSVKNNYILNLNMFYIFLCALSLKMPIVSRLRQATYFTILFSVPYLVTFRRKYKKLIFYFFVVVYIVLFVKTLSSSVLNSASPGAGILPYKSIFSK